MRFLRRLLLSGLLLAGSLGAAQPALAVQKPVVQPAPVTVAAPDPSTCVGYPETRVFIEQQAWWKASSGEAFPGRHTHLGLCFPVDGTVIRGTIHFDIRVLLHAQPTGAKFSRVRLQHCTSSSSCSSVFSITTGLNKPDSLGNLTQWFGVDVNTSGWSTGRHELRFGAYVDQPDGKQQFVSGGLQMCVNSCSPLLGRSATYWWEGRGWYTNSQYENGRFLSALPVAPLTGIWKPVIQCAAPSGTTPTGCTVAIDPDYHNGNLGTEIFRATGAAKTTLNIDMSTLSTGTHKLVIRTDSKISTGINSGLIVIQFKK